MIENLGYDRNKTIFKNSRRKLFILKWLINNQIKISEKGKHNIKKRIFYFAKLRKKKH